MKTYIRILKYVKPYWKHLTASVFCTILYAVLNGVSIYLTIPLLDTLFQQQNKNVVQQNHSNLTTSILPDWIINIGNEISQEFSEIILSGDKIDALVRICTLVFFAFLLKIFLGICRRIFLLTLSREP